MEGGVPLRVLSYNVFIRPPFIFSTSNGWTSFDFKDSRLAAMVPQFAKYDLVLLQELFGSFSKRQSRVIELCRDLGFPYFVRSPRANWCQGKFVDSGLLILSRYPILDTAALTFTRGCCSDRASAKGALYAKLMVGRETVHVFNTHTQASYVPQRATGYTPEEQFADIRASQAKELAEFVNSHAAPGQPVIIAGDLNVDARPSLPTEIHSQEYLRLLETLRLEGYTMRDVLFEAGQHHPVTSPGKEALLDCCDCDPSVRKRLDYIFLLQPTLTAPSITVVNAVVEPFQVEGAPFTHLSDHFGVSATFTVD